MYKSCEDTNCCNSLRKKQKIWMYVKHVKRLVNNLKTINNYKKKKTTQAQMVPWVNSTTILWINTTSSQTLWEDSREVTTSQLILWVQNYSDWEQDDVKKKMYWPILLRIKMYWPILLRTTDTKFPNKL